MPAEQFTNLGQGTVTSGGTDAPSAGTSQSWTVNVTTAFPAASAAAQFHGADPALPGEIFLVTASPGGTGSAQSFTVTRGAESTAPAAHASGFTLVQVIAAGYYASVVTTGGAVFAGAVSMTPVTLTDAATIAVNAALGNQFKVTLGGNRTLGAPSNPASGQVITVWFIQDGTGSRAITLASGAGGYHFGTDLTSVTLSTTAGATDRMTCQYDSVNNRWDVTGFLRGW